MFRRPHRDAGTMTAEYQEGKLNIQGAAGIFFLVLGTVIMLVALLKPMTFGGKTIFVTPEGEVLQEDFQGAPARAPSESIRGYLDSLGAADSAGVR